MRKSSKLVSFLCSLALSASAFTGVVTVNAADETEITQGVVLNYVAEESSAEKAVVEINAVGFDSLKSFQINIVSETEGANIVDYEYKANNAAFAVTANVNPEHVYKMVGSINTADEPSVKEDNLIGTVTLTFENPLTEDAVLSLAAGSLLSGTADGAPAKIKYDGTAADTMQASKVTALVNPTGGEATTEPTAEVTTEPTAAPTAEATTEPTATPYVAERPTKIPEATVAPTAEPTATPEAITQGVVLTYDEENSTSEKAVVGISAVGFDSLKSFQINIVSETEGVNIVDYEYKANNEAFAVTANVNPEHVYKMVGSINTADEPSVKEDNLIGTVTLTFENPLTEDAVLSLAAGSLLSGTADGAPAKIKYDGTAADTMKASKITVLANPNAETPTTAPTEEPEEFKSVGEVNVGKVLPDSVESDKLAGVVVEITKADGTAAEYGTDYVAVVDGKQLTKDEFTNMINGYVDGTVADALNKINIKVKDYGTTVKVTPAYAGETEDTWVVQPGMSGSETVKEETEATTVTLTLSKPSNGTIYGEYTDAEGKTVKMDSYGTKYTLEKGTKVTFTAVANSGYTFKSWSGISSSSVIAKDVAINKTTTVSATFNRVTTGGSTGSTGSGSTSSDDKGGTGQIAGPSTTTPGTTPSTSVNFQDLGSVEWARTAINTLVNMGVLNGRSDTIFDPNASVTRAEFTKMVCGAFGIAQTPNATQTFTDVAPTDWFYGYVQAAAAKGIVNGVSDTAFDPNATIKRQEMAAILYRTIQATNALSLLPTGAEKVFADADQIDEYAQIPVSTLSGAGVINGVTDTTFEPYATATRAQAACIIYQYYDAIGAV